MAIKTLSNENESGSGLEFIADWLEPKHAKEKQVIDGKAWDIKSISVSTSGKGYTAITSDFMVFFWKKSPEGQMIKEWIETSEGFQPVIVISLDRKSRCLLGEDDERTVFFEQGSKGSNRYKIYDDPHSKYSGRDTLPQPESPNTEATTSAPTPRKHSK